MSLGYSSLICAKKIISESGLFIFKQDLSVQGGRETASWMVKNLHGSRMKEFWEKANAENQQPNAEISDKDAGSEEIGALNQASILGQSQSKQGFQETSRTAQEHLTNSNDEFVRCISDTLTGNSREEETAPAPFGVASPLSIQSVSEKEKVPMAMHCTTLMLVDGTQGQSTLLPENQDCGVEPRDCHRGAFSAGTVAQNEKFLSLAIANQTPELLEQDQSVSVLGKNLVSGDQLHRT